MSALTRYPAAAVLAVALLGHPAGARSQDVASLAMNCIPDNIADLPATAVPDEWRTYLPGEVVERALAELATTDRWELAADVIRHAFLTMADTADLDATRRTAMLAELAAMARDLAERAGSRAGLDNGGRFQVTQRSRDLMVLAALDGPDLEVRSDDAIAVVRTICWTAAAADEVLGLANGNARAVTLRALRKAVAAWDAFNTAGYAQYPWELLLNRPDNLNPPRHQVVLLHPGPGIEVPGMFEDLGEANRTETVMLEVIGLLRYTGGRAFYYGASGVVSLPGHATVGAGLLAHVGPLKAGYIWRQDPARNGLLVTADLLQLVSDAPDLYQALEDGARELLSLAR